MSNVPIAMVDLGIVAQELLLTLLVGPVSTDLVAVLLSLQEGDEVDASPHLLTGKLTAKEGKKGPHVSYLPGREGL